MKKLIVMVLASFALALTVHAQKTPKVLVVDMVQLYNGYYKAQEAQAKLASSADSAQQEFRSMVESGMALAKEQQEAQARSTNPALTPEAQAKARDDANAKAEELRKKEIEINTFRQNTDQTLQQRRNAIVQLHINEIRDVVTDYAKKKGADLVLNSANGNLAVYVEESMDVTKDVLGLLNANAPKKPAGAQ